MKRLFAFILVTMAAVSLVRAAAIVSYVQINPPNGKQAGTTNVGTATATRVCFDDGSCQTTASISGSSGASALEVLAGVVRSSPTATLSLNPLDFSARVTGATFYFALNPATTNYIHNQSTLQSGASYYVFLGSATMLSAGSIYDTSLPPSECVQTAAGGRLTTTGAPCGSGGGGGSSSLQVTQSLVQITSPTATINFTGAGVSVSASGSTATVTIAGGGSATLNATGVGFGSAANAVTSDTASFSWTESSSTLKIAAGTAMSVAGSTTSYNMKDAGFVVVKDHLAYMSAFSGNSLSIFDVAVASNPQLIGQILATNTVPVFGLEGMEISGNYLYAVSLSSNALLIFDISTPANPSLVSSTISSSLLSGPAHIRIIGNYAYIANFNSTPGSTNGVSVYDISNPASPQYVSGIVSSNISSPVYLQTRYPYLYVANSNTNCFINVIDISNPRTPSLRTSFAPSGCSQPLVGMDLYGKYLYAAGRDSQGIFTVDISTPTSPVSLGFVTSSPESPITPVVVGDKLFVTFAGVNKVAQYSLVFPSTPTLVNSISDGTRLIKPDDIMVNGSYAYITTHGSGSSFQGGLAILNIGSLNVPAIAAGTAIVDEMEVTHTLQAGKVTAGTIIAPTGWIRNQLGVGNIQASSSSATNTFAGQIQANSSVTVASGGLNVNGSGLSQPIYVTNVGSTAFGTLMEGSGDTVIGNTAYKTGSHYLITGVGAGAGVVSGQPTNRDTFIYSYVPSPGASRSPRLYLGSSPYLDGTSSASGSRGIILAPTGVLIDPSSHSVSGVALSTAIAPFQVGYGTLMPQINGVSTTTISLASMLVNYPNESFVIAVDSNSKVSTLMGVKGGKSVIGTSTTTWSLPTADGSGCWQSNGSGVLSISSCGSGGGGGSVLEVLARVQISSPTSAINFLGTDFQGTANGTTAQIALNPATTNFIHNQNTIQSGTTFYTSFGNIGEFDGDTKRLIIFSGQAGSTTNSDMLELRNRSTSTGQKTSIVFNEGSTGTNPVTRLQSSDNTTTNGTNFKVYLSPDGGSFRSTPNLVLTGATGLTKPAGTYNGINVDPPSATWDVVQIAEASSTADPVLQLTPATNSTNSVFKFKDKSGIVKMDMSAVGGAVTLASSYTVTSSSGAYFKYNVRGGSFTADNITGSTQCLQADSSGNITGTGSSCSAGGSGGSSIYAATATASFPFGFTVSTISVVGSGDGSISFTIGGSTYGVISSSFQIAAGHLLISNSTNYTVGDGGVPGTGGSGTPALPFGAVQYNNAGSFGGSNNFQYNGSSVTLISSMSITDTAGRSNANPGQLDVFMVNAVSGQALFSVGSANQHNQVVVRDQSPLDLSLYGVRAGNLNIGRASFADKVMSANSTTQHVNLWNAGQMDLMTATVANGGTLTNSIVFKPNETTVLSVSTSAVTTSTNTYLAQGATFYANNGGLSVSKFSVGSLGFDSASSLTLKNAGTLILNNPSNNATGQIVNNGGSGQSQVSVTATNGASINATPVSGIDLVTNSIQVTTITVSSATFNAISASRIIVTSSLTVSGSGTAGGLTVSTNTYLGAGTTVYANNSGMGISGGLMVLNTGNASPYIAAFATSTVGLPLLSISTSPAVLPSDYALTITSPTTSVTVFGVQADGHVISSGTAPTVSSCGTSPSVDANSTDFAMTINTGSASPTACTVTFANAFANTPVCVVSDDLQTSEPAITTRSTTGFTVTLGAALNSGHLFVICVGQKG